jgi:hypothetical protein
VKRGGVPLGQIVSIVLVLVCLVAVIVFKRSCARAVSGLFETVATPPDAGSGAPPADLQDDAGQGT